MDLRNRVSIRSNGNIEFGPNWSQWDVEPCPICSENIMAVRPLITEPASVPVGIFNYPEPAAMYAMLAYPCLCEIPAADWSLLMMNGCPGRWVNPSKIEEEVAKGCAEPQPTSTTRYLDQIIEDVNTLRAAGITDAEIICGRPASAAFLPEETPARPLTPYGRHEPC